MPYTIEKLADLPVVILTIDTTHLMEEIDEIDPTAVTMMDAQTEPTFLIFDMRKTSVNMDDITGGAARATRGPGALLHHANIRESLVITNKGLVKLAVQGLRSATFGNVHVRAFDEVEEAVAYCREQIAIAAGSPD